MHQTVPLLFTVPFLSHGMKLAKLKLPATSELDSAPTRTSIRISAIETSKRARDAPSGTLSQSGGGEGGKLATKASAEGMLFHTKSLEGELSSNFLKCFSLTSATVGTLS